MQCRDGGGSAGAGTWPRHPAASRSRSLHGCRGSGAALQVGCLKLGCLWPRVYSGVLGKETSLKPEDEQAAVTGKPVSFPGGSLFGCGFSQRDEDLWPVGDGQRPCHNVPAAQGVVPAVF